MNEMKINGQLEVLSQEEVDAHKEIFGLYVYRDESTGNVSPVSQAQNEKLAIRYFIDALKNMPNKEDISLIQIGWFVRDELEVHSCYHVVHQGKIDTDYQKKLKEFMAKPMPYKENQ